ncbi:MAG: hypothetical protein AB1589_01445 [Cyanobacteriota bacterium]
MQGFWIDPTDKSGGLKQGKFFFLSTAQVGGLYPALDLVISNTNDQGLMTNDSTSPFA